MDSPVNGLHALPANAADLGGDTKVVLRREKWARLNLTVAAGVDEVLADLQHLTGKSKSSFAADALTWYYPRLLRLRNEIRDGINGVRAGKASAPVEPAGAQRRTGGDRGTASETRDGVPMVRLSRAERRAREREQRRAEKKRR